MSSRKMLVFLLFLSLSIEFEASKKCEYPAIFNFGDSNSDTGAISAAFTLLPPPNGQNFFGSFSGRASDGRLIIDFITEELKLPYLSAYLNSVGANFSHGANFATGGSSIRAGGGFSPFHLGLQISQFILFKSRTNILFNHNRTEPSFKSSVPSPDDFSRAIYTIDIGQNDLTYDLLQNNSQEQIQGSIPNMMRQFSKAVKKLYRKGARVFWIHNTGPLGCLPFNFLSYEPKKQGDLDANGCVKPHNEVAQEFNKQLKEQVFQLRRMLPLAKFTYVDVYTAKYQLVTNATRLGFTNPMKFCCGSYRGYEITCGYKTSVNNETVFSGNACKNPSKLISWDGIHYSQAANSFIAKGIVSGTFSDPPLSIGEACF